MPRIVPHAILPVKTAGEVKGRDFFTLSGKSQRLSLQDVGNASVQPTSLKGSTPRMKGTLLMSALGLGAAACLPPSRRPPAGKLPCKREATAHSGVMTAAIRYCPGTRFRVMRRPWHFARNLGQRCPPPHFPTHSTR